MELESRSTAEAGVDRLAAELACRACLGWLSILEAGPGRTKATGGADSAARPEMEPFRRIQFQ